MKVRNQIHAPSALLTERSPWCLLKRKMAGHQSQPEIEEKTKTNKRKLNIGRQVLSHSCFD